MTRGFVIRIGCRGLLLALGVIAAGPAPGQSFQTRLLEVDTYAPGELPALVPKNIDVALSAGQIVVGYDLPYAPNFGDGVLAYLPTNSPWVDRRLLPHAVGTLSMQASAAGWVSYASSSPAAPIRIGNDLTALGLGVVGDAHPDSGISPASLPLNYALDHHARPALVGGRTSVGTRYLSTYDPATGDWTTRDIPDGGLAHQLYGGTAPHALTFDADNNPIVAYNTSPSVAPLRVMRETAASGWTNLAAGESAFGFRGVSVAAAPSGEVAFAFINPFDELTVGLFDGVSTSFETVSSTVTNLSPRSLAYDPSTGRFALVHTDGIATTSVLRELKLSTRTAPGVWSTTTVASDALRANLAFDPDGNTYIGAVLGSSIALISDAPGLTLPTLGDFDLDDDATAADLPGFVQALNDMAGYLNQNPALNAADVVMRGDFTGDLAFNENDAFAALDADAFGLGSREAGYAAFENETLDQFGQANPLNVTLANPNATYNPGDSRADFTGPTAGEADGSIDADDIDYLFAQINAANPDPRANLNDGTDSVVNLTDALILIEDILETRRGDVSLDGVVDITDLQTLAANWQQGGGWAGGDANGDGVIDEFDLALMAANWGFGTPDPDSAPTFAEAMAAVTFVPEPGTALALGLMSLITLHRCARR